MQVTCGCGKHEINPNQESVVFWKEDWWFAPCFNKKRDARINYFTGKISKLENEIKQLKVVRKKYILLKSLIKKFKCERCGFAIGNRWSEMDGQLICGTCNYLDKKEEKND